MTLAELARSIGARIVTGSVPATRQVERVHAGDRMSEILAHSSDGTLVVTNLVSQQLLRAAALMDLGAVCLLNGVTPDPALVATAAAQGTVLMVAPGGMFETCGRIYECLGQQREPGL